MKTGRRGSSRGSLQGRVHLLECIFRLLKEAEYNRLGELALLLIIVHLEYLLERREVYRVPAFRKASRAIFGLADRSASRLNGPEARAPGDGWGKYRVFDVL